MFFFIVIPHDLLQQYNERWFECFTETKQLETYIDKSTSIQNVTFRTACSNYMSQLNSDKIASLIWNADVDFINTMFVMSEEDVKDNDKNRYERFGIIISDDLPQHYIERWYECLTNTRELQKYIEKIRPIKNETFRYAMCNLLRKLNTHKNASLIWNANEDLINTMLVK